MHLIHNEIAKQKHIYSRDFDLVKNILKTWYKFDISIKYKHTLPIYHSLFVRMPVQHLTPRSERVYISTHPISQCLITEHIIIYLYKITFDLISAVGHGRETTNCIGLELLTHAYMTSRSTHGTRERYYMRKSISFIYILILAYKQRANRGVAIAHIVHPGRRICIYYYLNVRVRDIQRVNDHALITQKCSHILLMCLANFKFMVLVAAAGTATDIAYEY